MIASYLSVIVTEYIQISFLLKFMQKNSFFGVHILRLAPVF